MGRGTENKQANICINKSISVNDVQLEENKTAKYVERAWLVERGTEGQGTVAKLEWVVREGLPL